MRKMIAMLLTISMIFILFAGCGGNEAPVSSAAPVESTAEEAPAPVEESVVSVAEEPASVEEDVPTEEIPEDPTELGKWIWNLADEMDLEIYAEDYDMDMTMDMTLLEQATSQRISGRVQYIESDTGYTYHEEETTDGATSESWYKDGMVYQSSSLGSYKAPIPEDDFKVLMDEDASDDLMEINADSFGTLVGEVTDSGYKVTFGDVNLDAWMAFAGLFESITDDGSATCTAFTLDGWMETNQDGYAKNMEMTMVVSFDIMGITMDLELTIHMSSNAINENVTIHVPETDSSFVEISDINIPTAYVDGFNAMLAEAAMNYEGVLAITITDGETTEVMTQSDSIYYIMDLAGLSVQWDTTLALDGEVVSQSSDVYSGGQGVVTDETGEAPYTYDDVSFASDINSFLTYYADSFDYGSGHQLSQENGNTVLSYDLSSDYVESVAAGHLSGADIDMTEATDLTSAGTMTFWFDESGMLVSQLLDCTLEMNYDGVVLTVSILDGGDVMAIGDAVIMPSSAY